MHWSVYYVAYLLPLTAFLGLWSERAWFLTPAFSYGLVPAVDLIFHRVWGEVDDELSPDDEYAWVYRATLWAWPLVETVLMVRSIQDVVRDGRVFSWRFCARVLAMGFVSAGGINVAHELFHKSSTAEKCLGRFLLILAGYGHFHVEHTLGHHRRVATPEDPATAPLGQSFYAFFPRVVWGSWCHAWSLRPREVAALVLAETLGAAVVCTSWGLLAMVFFAAQALVAIFILEKINYIEQYVWSPSSPNFLSLPTLTPSPTYSYGLRRIQHYDGSFEKIGPQHSWDAPQTVTNVMLFKLQRHSDHHLRK